MNGYLFDTCIVRRWFGGNQALDEKIALLDQNLPSFTSVITRGEIEFAHTGVAATDLAKQHEFRRWIRDTFSDSNLEVGEATAQEYAKWRRALFNHFTKPNKFIEEREDLLGRKLGVDENDVWLLAQACERNLKLLTLDKMSRLKEVVELTEPGRIEVWKL